MMIDLITVGNIFGAFVAIFLLYLTTRDFRHFSSDNDYWRRKGVKGPKALPIIGTAYEELYAVSSTLQKRRYEKYGRVFGTMQFQTPVLSIGDPALIKLIRITDFKYFTNHRNVVQEVPLFSKFMAELNDDEWKRVRTITSPVFSSGKLRSMVSLIERCVNNSLQYCAQIAKESREIDLKKFSTSYTMDTIAICAFAMETNGYKCPNNEFIRNGIEIAEIKLWRLFVSKLLPTSVKTKLNLHFVSSDLTNYFSNLLTKVIDERRRLKVQRDDFVNLLLNAELKKEEIDEQSVHSNSSKRKLTDEEIIGNSILFFLAGLETTSTLLQFTLYSLALNQKVQQRLYEEIKQYFNKNKNEAIDYESLMSLPYLDAVINEALRMYPPIVTFDHVCSEDYKLADTGITIDKGTVVNIPFNAMHYDPEFFPEPEKFDPDRFLPENKENIRPYTFLPFGTGPRMCIGMRFALLEAKMFLANLINNFEVTRSKNTPEKPTFTGIFYFLHTKPLFATLKRRD